MPLYTRRGDKGTTGLLGNIRVPKSHLLLDIIGTIDEVDAALGVARSQCRVKENCEIIYQVQIDLWQLMADVASINDSPEKRRKTIAESHIIWMEDKIAELEKSFQLPNGFIVPGDSYPAALLDVSRTIARRAERRLVTYVEANDFHNPYVMQYLNRLSSLCYALELRELSWEKEQPKPS